MSEPHSQTPIVSIVIPTFNRSAMLKEAVDSCLNQRLADIEIIIVDDGSTDATAQVVVSQMEGPRARARLQYFRQANQGAASARNYGLRVAAGQFVQFLDSDDLLGPAKIDKQVEVLLSEAGRDASCCVCLGRLVDRADVGVSGAGQRIGVHRNTAAELIRELCTRQVHVVQTAAPLWRREFLLGQQGWREDISLGDDLEYHARLLAAASDVRFVNEELFYVREHAGDRLSTVRPTVSAVESQVKARRSVHESASRAGLWDERTQAAFLHAMRTIYANALETRDQQLIAGLERWLWEIASAPKSRLGMKAIISARRVLGRQFLLSVHRLARRSRAA